MEVRIKRCGDNNRHWYFEGDTCICGQVPQGIFFAANCTCGARRYIYPVHKPDCAYVLWCKKRNLWIQQHPNLRPPLGKARPDVEVVEASEQIKKGEVA